MLIFILMLSIIGLPIASFLLFSKLTSSITEDCMAQPARGVPEWNQ